ncbi:MAG: LamG domain-containing protein, partial [Akkermansiaceae bacterium]
MKKNNYLIIAAAASGIIAAAAPQAQGTVIWTAGAPGGTSGGALDFDQSLILDTGVATNDIYGGGSATGDYTVSAWINPDVVSEGWFIGTTNQALHLGIKDNNALRQGHWGNDSSGSTAIIAGEWVHTTFAYEAGTISIYVNGALDVANVVGGPDNANGNIVIGGRIRNDSAGEFTGLNRQPFDGQ